MSEFALHCAVARFLTVALQSDVPWSAVGHGGGGAMHGARLKQMGVARGVPDLFLIGAQGRIHFIELKFAKGRESPDQKAFMAMVLSAGGRTAVCRSVAEVEAALVGWGFKLRATVQ